MGEEKERTRADAIRASIISASSSKDAEPVESLDNEDKRADIEDKKAETKLKKCYAKYFIWILIGQLVAMNAVFIGVGVGCLEYKDSNHLSLYMGGTLTEVFGVVFVITRYLFSKKHKSS